MMSDATIRERVLLESLRQDYEARGFRFVVAPPPDALPISLDGYHPDAVALGDNGGIIFATRTGRKRAADAPSLDDISARVSHHPGWKFFVLYSSEPPDAVPDIPDPTWDEVRRTLAEAAQLADDGHARAAFLLGWVALEALARLTDDPDSPNRRQPYPASGVIHQLTTNGYMDNDVARRLRESVVLRNRAVHGDFTAPITPETVADLLRQAAEVIEAFEAEAALRRPH